jgi:hypothetical protein
MIRKLIKYLILIIWNLDLHLIKQSIHIVMRNIEKALENYLSKPTEFALQIVGGWGIGKTYLYRTRLEGIIIGKPTFGNAAKKYKPIYVSLFGLKSIEDIATKIVIEFYQSKYFAKYMKKQHLSVTESILKIGFRGFLSFGRLGNLKDYLTEIKELGKNTLDANELVICFDDLERKDSSFKIEDLTGYINSLVDERVKVIILSNDIPLFGENESYKNLKEKIIGISIPFIPETADTIMSIVKTRYEGFSEYQKHLIENLQLLTRFTRSVGNNFRHVIYALDCVQNCFSILKNDVIDCEHEIHTYVTKEMNQICSMVFIFTMEYKSSRLKYSDIDTYKDFNTIMLWGRSSFEGKNQNENTSAIGQLISRYHLAHNEYQFYESIFRYATAQDEFQVDLFIREFTEKFKLDKGKVLPQYVLLESLSYPKCYQLTDSEYKEKTLSALEFAKEGLYKPSDYLNVTHFLERFDNILELDIEKIKEELIVGLKKSVGNVINFEVAYSNFETTGAIGFKGGINEQLYSFGLYELNLLKINQLKQKQVVVADMFCQNLIEFQNRIESDLDFHLDVKAHSFLVYADIGKLIHTIQEADGPTLFFLRHFFTNRYDDKNKLKEEASFIGELIELLDRYLGATKAIKEGKIRIYLIKSLTQSLTSLVEQYGQG